MALRVIGGQWQSLVEEKELLGLWLTRSMSGPLLVRLLVRFHVAVRASSNRLRLSSAKLRGTELVTVARRGAGVGL